ncbi:hypothetical protein [Micromonospora nigra]|uniref:hypothetical protein n=1 Tax=Micromonospora nigra TaxID=145857 RepID=UPI001112CCD8|nr:hypothetical protein [Micromonospora nigra]
MSRLQTVYRPAGPITADVLVRMLAELGETPPPRVPRPYTKNAAIGVARRGHRLTSLETIR